MRVFLVQRGRRAVTSPVRLLWLNLRYVAGVLRMSVHTIRCKQCRRVVNTKSMSIFMCRTGEPMAERLVSVGVRLARIYAELDGPAGGAEATS